MPALLIILYINVLSQNLNILKLIQRKWFGA